MPSTSWKVRANHSEDSLRFIAGRMGEHDRKAPTLDERAALCRALVAKGVEPVEIAKLGGWSRQLVHTWLKR